MEPGRLHTRHGRFFWLLVASATALMSVEPALFLVVLALGLSAVTLAWIVMLVRFLLLDALGVTQDPPQCVVPRRTDSLGQ